MVNKLIDKAITEEKNFNWFKAANLYNQVKKEYIFNNEVYQAAKTCKNLGYAYARAAETSETANDYKELNKLSRDSYIEAAALFSQTNNIAGKLECEAEAAFIYGFIKSSITEMLEEFEKAKNLFLESNKVYSNQNNTKNVTHTYVRAAMTLSYLIPYYKDPNAIKQASKEGKALAQKARKLSEEYRDISSLSQSLFAEFFLNFFEGLIDFSRQSNYWKKIAEDLVSEIENTINVIQTTKNFYFLEMSYFVAGVIYNTFGFQFVKNEKEQQRGADLGFEYLKKAEILNKTTKNKLLHILTVCWTDWWSLFWSKFEYLQNRIQDDLQTIENFAKIIYGSFTHFNFFVNFVPTFIYANFAQRSFFTPSQRLGFAEKTRSYGKECLLIIPSAPISLWPMQMLTWAYAQLTNLTSTDNERKKYAQLMLQYAKEGEKLASNYGGGFVRASAYSSLYRAYQTLTSISEIKKERIYWLSNAIEAIEKYLDYAIESRAGIITAKVRIGLLYEELNLLTRDSNHLIKSKDLFLSVLKDCDERGYLSYAAVAYESLAHIEDKLSNYTTAANYYHKAQDFHSQSLENMEYEPLREKIIEKINYNNAWAFIEKAKACHKREDPQKAKNYYSTASEILKKLPSYKYEAPYFTAWALQEEAEQLSTLEHLEDAKGNFLKCKLEFENALDTFKNTHKDLKDSRERERIQRLIKVTKTKITYCYARSIIENARILRKKGDLLTAAEQLNLAASKFKEMSGKLEIEEEQENFNAFFYLCKAWESMTIAEKYLDFIKFQEAANLFTKSNKLFSDSRNKLLASGNAFFCQSLANGCKFDESSNFSIKEQLYKEIKETLRNASSLYQKGGFMSASGWVLATSTYFDANWHLIRADKELNLDEKEKLLKIGSSYLKSAAELFSKYNYKEKEKEILNQVEMVEKEEQILVSAIKTIREPSISRSTMGISTFTDPTESSISSTISEIRQFTEEARRILNQKKFELTYEDTLQKYPKNPRRQFRVAIAQIGKSSKGDILSELYDKKADGLFGFKRNEVKSLLSKIDHMIETALSKGVDLLIFPELTIDLNYNSIFEELLNYSRNHGIYIIPGSYHDEATRQNLSVIISPDGILLKQKKHIPAIIHIEGHRVTEKINVGSSINETIVCNTEFGRIAIVICRDFLDMDLRVELKNSDPPIDLIINPAFTPVTADFKAAHFDARRSIYAYCFFANVAEFGDSLIYSPEKEKIERTLPAGEENLIYKDVDLFKLRSERRKWEIAQKKSTSFIQSTR